MFLVLLTQIDNLEDCTVNQNIEILIWILGLFLYRMLSFNLHKIPYIRGVWVGYSLSKTL